MLKKIKTNYNGAAALLMTMMVLVGILTVTLAISDIVRSGLVVDRMQLNATKAYFAAEAGAERIIWEIRKNGLNPGDGSAGFCSDNPADFCFDNYPSGGVDECVSVGACSNFDKQQLSNETEYSIKFFYEEDGIGNSTTTLTCLGNYKEVNRVVELKY